MTHVGGTALIAGNSFDASGFDAKTTCVSMRFGIPGIAFLEGGGVDGYFFGSEGEILVRGGGVCLRDFGVVAPFFGEGHIEAGKDLCCYSCCLPVIKEKQRRAFSLSASCLRWWRMGCRSSQN